MKLTDFADVQQVEPSKLEQIQQMRNELAAIDHESELVISKIQSLGSKYGVIVDYVGSKLMVNG